ncbi:MAG: 3-hydroxyacyl-ACP dehydratase FabZ [Planctomycetota bacterium]|jgi:UDP-3-O-[3-hydroxymyristoyl] N-acetylglucosamine deacetylase/3-hydroxyacyl-[acyl-carrier-protein] dehydratase
MNAKYETGEGSMNIQEILEVAPHRYPFLLVDRILSSADGVCTGIKNITFNEPCFQGHFPDRPIFPGVLQIEALAQVGGIMVLRRPENKGKLAFFTSADAIKWRRQVTPGDTLYMVAKLVKEKRGLCVIEATASVDGELACEAKLKIMITDEQRKS